MGPNYVLDKGFKADAAAVAADFKFGRFCKFLTTDTSGQTVTSFAAATDVAVGVVQETLDAAKILTGKAAVNVRMLGIARVEASAAITLGQGVNTTANGRAVAAVAAGNRNVGIALTPAAAAGDYIEVLLTPSGQFS